MGAITDWITAIATSLTTAGGVVLFYLKKNESLPLIEAEAERDEHDALSDLVLVRLTFTNRIEEKLSVKSLKIKAPREGRLYPAWAAVDPQGFSRLQPELQSVETLHMEHKVPKSGAGFKEYERTFSFYVSNVLHDCDEVRVSLRLSSSARTIKNRRLTVRAKVQTQ